MEDDKRRARSLTAASRSCMRHTYQIRQFKTNIASLLKPTNVFFVITVTTP